MFGGDKNIGGSYNNFNRWNNPNLNYVSMDGYQLVDYSNGWNPNIHDQMLKNNIDLVFQKYDTNYTGQLEGNEFFNAYKDLSLRMGVCPPSSYQNVWSIVISSDYNGNGRISKPELFILFKRIQGINSGDMLLSGWGNTGMGNQNMKGMGVW